MTDEASSQNPAESPDSGPSKIPIEGLPAASALPPAAESPAEFVAEPISAPAPTPTPPPPPEPAPKPSPKEAPAPETAAGGAERKGGGAEPEAEKSLREPFPFVRLLYAVLFGIIASFAFWVVLLLAFLQFVTVAIAGEKNDELQQFSRQVAHYLKQMFDYMTLASDERPFPFGPFPKE
jgi:hypothetical protein